MSYHIYTTQALVLSERPLREADRVYSILTRDLGLIRATAPGVRKGVSKLQGSIEPYSFALVSFVRGKEYWRITNASLIKSLPHELSGRRELLKSFAKVFSLLEKLIVGEDRHPEILDDVENIINFILSIPEEDLNIESAEILLALRILFNLGYISNDDVSEEILLDKLSLNTLKLIKDDKKNIVKAINEGIQSSQLT